MDAGKILDDFRSGVITREQALERLNILPYEDIGFAKLDHHRQLRRGGVETVFCAGKTAEQVRAIFERFQAVGDNVLGTRATAEQAEYVCASMPQVQYDPASRLLTMVREPKPQIGCVAVCTGGTSDLPVAEEAAGTAEFFGARVKRFYDVGIAGIHRLFACIDEIRTANAVVAIAGMEGALGGVIAGLVSVPVVAVPTSVGYGASFKGVAPLLTMLNSCAEGMSVVNIDNGFGAGYLAARINTLTEKGHPS
ncbi:MAG: nickel pincer cofactor biosynthesis protein LarB [Lentisphaeria bacterium]|nr:nickel pincer cofactor biosynthesis protein LarB [Lentisphaeria bacterium]